MASRPTVCSLSVLAAFALPAVLAAALPQAGPPMRVGGLPDTPIDQGSTPRTWGEVDGAVVLVAGNAAGGLTLWRTDGTAAGTEALAELSPEAEGQARMASGMFRVGGRLLFFVGGLFTGADLWATDGTAAGTLLVAHLPRDSGHGPPAVFEDRLYFGAPDPDLGDELWVSDGTPAGTRVAVDLCPGPCSSYLDRLTAFPDRLQFTTLAPDVDRELWTTDGTAAGTVKLDVCPGECSSSPEQLIALGDRLLFVADDGVHGRELWASDGTTAGTRILADFNPHGDAGLQALFRLGNLLYFYASTGTGGPTIWRTDGTPAGTSPAPEFLDAVGTEVVDPIATVGDALYFGVSGFREEDGLFSLDLWILDRPAGTPRRVAGPFLSEGGSSASGAALPDGRLFFVTEVVESGAEPWVSDGTEAGTSLLADLRPGPPGSAPVPIAVLGPLLLFNADDGVHGEELWRTDGTAAGTLLVRDLLPERTSPDPTRLTAHAGELFLMTGADPANPRIDPRPGQLWRVVPGNYSELAATAPFEGYEQLVSSGGTLYLLTGMDFQLDAFHEGPGPHVDHLLPGDGLSPRGLIGELTPAVGGRLVFGTRGRGQELWASDGLPGTTRLVADLDPDWFDTCDFLPCAPGESYSPRELTAVGHAVYLVADLASGGSALWRTDGTAPGTRRVAAPLADFRSLATAGGRLLFAGLGSGGRWQLWATDGTPASTRYLAVLAPGETPGPTASGAGAAFVVSRLQGGGLRLWRSDGTPAGTSVVPLPGAGRFEDVSAMAVAGGRLYLSLFTAALGQELWTSETAGGAARPVVDLAPGPAGSWPTTLTPLGSFLVFAAGDPEGGREPWITDGTPGGTARLADLVPGPGSSEPTAFAWVGERLYVAASGDEVNRDLWELPLTLAGDGASLPPQADATEIPAPEYPDFRFWVRIAAGSAVQPVRRETLCIPETVCVSGAVPGRSELFLRIVGPKPNGYLWPTLVRFSTSEIDVWIEQAPTGFLRHYRLAGAFPGSSELEGRFDRLGFRP